MIEESMKIEILREVKLGNCQQEKIGYKLRIDSSVIRNLASKLVVEGRLIPIKTDGKVFYRIAKPSPNRIINTDQTYVMKEILREVNTYPGKSIRYISDKVSSRGIGKGYWSNQKLIHKLKEMGYVTLERSSYGRTTIKITTDGEKHLYNQDEILVRTKTVKSKPVITPTEKGFRFRIDSTVEGFARQIENLKLKYPEVTTFILKPVQPKI